MEYEKDLCFKLNIMNTTITYQDLPPVEKQVAELYSLGYTKKEIAMKRGRSINTISNEIRIIFEKIDVHKDTEFCTWYFITRFHLSLDLTPLQRTLTTICLLVIISVSTLFEINPLYRLVRSSRIKTETICSRTKRNEEIE